MADPFQPKFVDLVCNYTSTTGTGNFTLGPTVNGFSSFASALQPGDSFYYTAIGIDKPAEREVGRGTLQSNGTITRDPITGPKTNFSGGTKILTLVAAAEWYNSVQAGGGSGAGFAATRNALAGSAQRQSPAILSEAGREGLFVFDGSNLSAKVTADPYQGVYLAPSSDTTGTSGAWVRKFDGPVQLAWFGVANGASNNAARVESAIALFNAIDNRGAWLCFPRGRINIDRRIVITRPCRIEGNGMGGTDYAEYGSGPTILQFPAGSTGFRFKYGASPDAAGGYGSVLSNLWVRQTGALGTTGTGSYNTASPTTVTLAAAGDWQNGQVVWLEGAGPSIALQDRAFSTTAGSAVVNWTSTNGQYLGNAIGYVGQHIDVAGAGFPAGTTIVTWGIGTATLSNPATSTVSNATATIKCPLIAEIQSGGGTTTLTIDNPTYGQNVTNAVVRHAPAGIYIDTGGVVCRDLTVYYDVEGIGTFIRGSTSDGSVADSNQFYSCSFSSERAGVVLEGSDAQVNDFFGCNFAGPKVGVLDISLLGNSFFGGHWAFNCGIMVANYSAQTKIFGGYFETGTSYIAPGSSQCLSIGTNSMATGSGWQVITAGEGGYLTLSETHLPRLRVTDGGAAIAGSRALWAAGNINNAGAFPGMNLPGWAIGGGGSAGGNAYQIAYSTPDGAYTKGFQTATEFHFGTSFGGSQLLNLHPTSGVTTQLPLGYEAGAGGAATQATSKSTGVTLNKICGQITMNAAALAAAAVVEFTVTNSKVAATDNITLNLVSGAAATAAYRYWISAIAAGSFKIAVENRSAGSLSEALVLNFAVVKGVNA